MKYVTNARRYLFSLQMLRIRIGLIIQTMIAELSLALSDNQTNSIGRAIARHPGSQVRIRKVSYHLLKHSDTIFLKFNHILNDIFRVLKKRH